LVVLAFHFTTTRLYGATMARNLATCCALVSPVGAVVVGVDVVGGAVAVGVAVVVVANPDELPQAARASTPTPATATLRMRE
jgi:hypothetical protein